MTEEDAGQRSLTSRVIESFKARTSPLLKSIVSPRLDSPTILMAANEGRIPSDPACPRSREVTMLHHQSSDPITKHCPSSPPDNNMTTIIHHNVDACVECGSREARCPHRLQSVPTRNRVTSHNEERSPESPHHRGKKMVEAAAIAGATVGIAEAVHHMVEAKKESTGEAAGRKQSPFHRHRDSHSPTGHDEHSHRASLMASGAAAAALAEGVHKIRESRKERDKCRSSSSSSSRSEEEKKRKRSHRLRKAAIATGAGLVGLMSAENMHSHSHSHSRTRKHDKCKPEISCRPLVASTCLGGQRTTTRPSTPCRCERSVTPPRFKGAPAGCDGMLTKHRRVHTSSAVECKPLHSAESPSIEHPVRDAAIVGGGTLLALEMARKITASQSPAHKIHPSPHHHLNSLLTHSEVFELLKGVTSPVTCEDVKVLQNRMQRASELQQEAEHRIQADRNALESIEEALVQIQREESRLQWKSDETEKRMTTLEALHHHRGQESISLLRNEAKRLRSLISEIERKVAHEESEEKKRCAEEFGQMKHLTSRDKELIIAALLKLKEERNSHMGKAKEVRERIFDERRRLDILVDEHRSLEEQLARLKLQLTQFGCSHCQQKERERERHNLAKGVAAVGGGLVVAGAVARHNSNQKKRHDGNPSRFNFFRNRSRSKSRPQKSGKFGCSATHSTPHNECSCPHSRTATPTVQDRGACAKRF